MVDYYKDQKRDNNDMYLILTFSRNPLLIMERLLFFFFIATSFNLFLSIYRSIGRECVHMSRLDLDFGSFLCDAKL